MRCTAKSSNRPPRHPTIPCRHRPEPPAATAPVHAAFVVARTIDIRKEHVGDHLAAIRVRPVRDNIPAGITCAKASINTRCRASKETIDFILFACNLRQPDKKHNKPHPVRHEQIPIRSHGNDPMLAVIPCGVQRNRGIKQTTTPHPTIPHRAGIVRESSIGTCCSM